ncbi:MAG: hypothetical protein WA087_00305 [Candidatus Saccharimonadales bacterium]
MKKTVIITVALLGTVLILNSNQFGYSLVLFLLAGIIPGTNISFTPTQMMVLMAILGGMVIYWGFVTPTIRKYSILSAKPKRSTRQPQQA